MFHFNLSTNLESLSTECRENLIKIRFVKNEFSSEGRIKIVLIIACFQISKIFSHFYGL